MAKQKSLFEDDGFLDATVALVLKDRAFARQYGHLLESSDFKARTDSLHSSDRWIIATKALDHIKKHREPAGKLIHTELRAYAKSVQLSAEKLEKILKVADRLLKLKPAVSSVGDKVLTFKKEAKKRDAIDQLLDFQTLGQLDDAKWHEIMRAAIVQDEAVGEIETDYFSQLPSRTMRRLLARNVRYPLLMIEPFDHMCRAIARGQLGLVAAPWKGRKSLMLLHIAIAYCLQGLNVLFYTLEDPLEDVEDRLDAMITHVPIKLLRDKYRLVEKRFPRMRRMIAKNLRIRDCTVSGLTIDKVTDDLKRLQEIGINIDSVIIDYDDEITPPRKATERRHEFADIYRAMRKAAASTNSIWWTAAQTNKESEGKKLLTGKDLAEDVSKARKVFFMVGIGASPDWGENGNYLYVSVHKNDRRYIGCNIMGDPDRMIFYHHEKTMKAQKATPQP